MDVHKKSVSYCIKLADGTRPLVKTNWVEVWEWDKRIFRGSAKGFLRYCEKQVKPAVIPPEATLVSNLSAVLGIAA